MSDGQDFNSRMIAEFRENGSTAMFGDHLVVLHTIGAKSGEERENPLAAIRQEDGSWLIAASAAGSDRHPAWFHNLVASPEVTFEHSGVHDGTGIRAVASTLVGPERNAGYAQFVRMNDGFRGYEQMTDRVIPVVRLTPVDAG